MPIRGLITTIALVWMVIGALAAWQRDYFQRGPTSCASAGTIALTVLAGPLNYADANPRVNECHLPQPSSMAEVTLRDSIR